MSEYRIWPGTGKLFVRRDGKPVYLGSSKAQSLTLQRKKPAKLMWTQAWRRLHKKGLSEANLKKRRTRTNKVQRAVVGLSLDDIKKKLKKHLAQRNEEANLDTLEAIKANLTPKKSSLAAEMLDTANTYDDKVALIRMLVREDSGRVANVLKGMIKSD